MSVTQAEEARAYDDHWAWSILHASVIIVVGFACQAILVKLFPLTGLGRILSVPLGLLFSTLVAFAYVKLYRRVQRPIRRVVLFAGSVVLVCAQAITFHPQDNMVSVWVLPARGIFSAASFRAA